jgi:uncharacterized membrane protein YbaN (DUF454 family)
MIKNNITRVLVLVAGFVSLVIGIIGIFLPLLPTTPFVILSAYCFGKSSKKIHKLLMQQKYFGKIILEYEQNKIIRPKIKVIAITSMWVSLLLSITFFMPYYWVKAIVVAIGICVTVYLVRFPSGK